MGTLQVHYQVTERQNVQLHPTRVGVPKAAATLERELALARLHTLGSCWVGDFPSPLNRSPQSH